VRLLLDTHVALWAIIDDPRLGSAASLIADLDNTVLVSAISIMEISIKHARNSGAPHDMPISGTEALRLFQEAGYAMVPFAPRHAAALDLLPPLHKDPFDRALVAQALTEPFRLVTRDRVVASYSDTALLI